MMLRLVLASRGIRLCMYVALVCGFFACNAQEPPAPMTASVFVVRRAEKADLSDPDTPLSSAGEARAQALAAVLKDRGVKAVYATEFMRTQQTGRPVAQAAGVEVTVITNADRATLIERARAVPMGSAVLIVGHSNTVPDIVRELSGGTVDGISENEFDNLYEVVFEADGRERLVRSKYGEPSR
jgi:phosphohistidine phosphatase SixA